MEERGWYVNGGNRVAVCGGVEERVAASGGMEKM